MIKFLPLSSKANALYIVIVFLTIPSFLFSQKNTGNKNLEHQLFIEDLKNSESIAYNEIVKKYDDYLKLYPNDVSVQIEKCKFIQLAQYNEYDEINPNQASFDKLSKALFEKYPDHPKVLAFRVSLFWGEELEEVLTKCEKAIKSNPDSWDNSEKGKVYFRAASYNFNQDNFEEALGYINLALEADEDYGEEFLHAKILIELEYREEALSALEKTIDSTSTIWELNQKANLFLQLNDYENALSLYNKIHQKDSTYQNNAEIAKTLTGIKKYEAAREYLVKDTVKNWYKEKASLNLFLHDLEHQADSLCLQSYNAYRELGYSTDPLAIYRTKLFFAHPFLTWKGRDFIGLFTFLIVLIVLILIPSIWILPVYTIGHKWNIVDKFSHIDLTWGLKSFWWISAGYLIASFISLFAEPEEIYSLFNWQATEVEITGEKLGISVLIFIIVLSIFSFAALTKTTLYLFLPNKWTTWQTIKNAVGYFFIYKIILGFYIKIGGAIFDVSMSDLTTIPELFLSSREDINALFKCFGTGIGFLLIGILVPIYEELIFRGIILDSCKRYIYFNWANFLQAMLFAAIHGELFLFPAFFAFGYIAGVLRLMSGSILPGIIFHSINNMLAVLVILARGG